MSVAIVLIIIFIVVYIASPTWVKLILFIANLFIPDPIPYVDEVIMLALLVKSFTSSKDKQLEQPLNSQKGGENEGEFT